MSPMTKEENGFEFLKIEYEKAAERYNNIYQSAWTIFSYMSAVTAGLIAFGADRLTNAGLSVLACLPLVFWFWSTYLPLDRYGNKTLATLRRIEEKAAKDLDQQFNHFTSFARDEHGIWSRFWTEYQKTPDWAGRKAVLQDTVGRARFAICLFSLLLHLFLAYSLCNLGSSGFSRQLPEAPVYKIEVIPGPQGTPPASAGELPSVPAGRLR